MNISPIIWNEFAFPSSLEKFLYKWSNFIFWYNYELFSTKKKVSPPLYCYKKVLENLS